VLRVSTAAHTRRLEYEMQVASLLPPEVRHPGVVAHGRQSFGEWLVVHRRPGVVLSRAWAALSEPERERAVTTIGRTLQAIHGVEPAAAGVRLEPPFLAPGSLQCPHQLPPARTLELVEQARGLAHVDRRLLDDIEALVTRASTTLGPDDERFLVHSDLHFENVLWDDGDVAAVLDFEWARLGPRDLDLEVILRFCFEPALHVAADYAGDALRDEYRQVPTWLRAAYPALFEHPRLAERLALFAIAYDVRDLLQSPPPTERRAPVHHPLGRLRAIVEGRSHAQVIEW
jgi:hygromycin-B 7''-O-kinase